MTQMKVIPGLVLIQVTLKGSFLSYQFVFLWTFVFGSFYFFYYLSLSLKKKVDKKIPSFHFLCFYQDYLLFSNSPRSTQCVWIVPFESVTNGKQNTHVSRAMSTFPHQYW